MIVKTLKKDSDFVAFVNDIDLTKSLLEKDVLKLDKLINKYAVLIFRNQNVSDEQQIKFTELFGKIEESGVKSNITKPDARRLSTKIADVSNIDKNSKVKYLD